MQKIITLKNIQKICILLGFVFVFGCDNASNEKTDTQEKSVLLVSQNIPTNLISLNDKGVAEMGYFNYSLATETFQQLLEHKPDWLLAQLNLVIALLNRQKPGDEELALSMAEKIASTDDSNLVAQYIIGILKFNQGLCEEALPRFKRIMAADKTDAYALYFAGQCEIQSGNLQAALDLYQQAINADSYLRSAYYGSFMAAQRLQKADLAMQMLDAYQRLDSNPKAKLAEIKYTRMGPKAIAQTYSATNPSQTTRPEPMAPYFLSPKLLAMEVNNVQKFGLVSLQHNAEVQLYVVDANQLKIYADFILQPQLLSQYSIALDKGEHNLAWADINNDGLIDVYISGQNDQLYLQSEAGFEPVDMQAFGFGVLSSIAVRLVDADHDGDLDVLLLNQSGAFALWNNNLNNTFTLISEEISLPINQGFKGIFVHDLDADRDTDIVLYSDEQLTVLVNDRMWDYQSLKSEPMLGKILSLSLADNDISGRAEMYLLMDNNSIGVYQLKQNKISLTNTIALPAAAGQHLSIDSNGNGLFEHLLLGSQGFTIIDNQAQVLEQILVNNIKSTKIMNTSKGPELLFLAQDKLYYSGATDQRLPFVLLGFSGKQDDANSMRSNFSGIGTKVVLHNQGFYAIGDSFHNNSGIEQDYQAINLAAGANKSTDFIAIDWSDGVYQTELALTSGQYHAITETQRQLSSCPVVFVWNNGQYEFISDVLGVGGIGFALARHQYGQPRAWENYLLNANQISAVDGVFKLQFTEPMEESAYLDALHIQVLDVPKQWSVMLDERMQISAPTVTGEPVFYQNLLKPIQILNKFNQDVTVDGLSTDKIAIDIHNQDTRFLGLVDEQIISMEFAQDLQGDYQLLMNGWVEYGYSQTMFAAWQAGISAQAPSLEYKVDGQWKTLLSEFGYPAGMPREASVAVHIPAKTRFLRIRTTMEIYFDQLALAQAEHPENIQSYQLSMQSAKLRQLGFPKRTDNAQRVPSYDFHDRQAFWDTRYMQGAYTQLGDVTQLVSNQDNALAIIAAGEGIEFEFVDDLPVLAENYQRYYILQFKGWAKDMDILTKDGETLTPIPYAGKVSEHARQLNQHYNNRYQAGK